LSEFSNALLLKRGDVCSALAGDSDNFYPGPYLKEREQEKPSDDAKDRACSNMSDPSDHPPDYKQECTLPKSLVTKDKFIPSCGLADNDMAIL